MSSNRLVYAPRAFRQDAHNAMKGDIVRGLIEAITNADDAYGEQPGKIRVSIERRRNGSSKVVVRDRAGGMRADLMKEAIGNLGGRTSGFEQGQNVRGNLGRGAKDLAAFGPVTFQSIRDGFFSNLTLKEDGAYEMLPERRARAEDYEALGVKRNGSGTLVTINVGPGIRIPQHDKLVEKLSTHYQLRDIASNPRRDLTVEGSKGGRVDAIRYSRPSLKEVHSSEIEVVGFPGATARLTIWRNPDCYDNPSSDPGRPEGILIVGGRAVYENTLFRFEGKPYSGCFSGRLECPYIDELARDYDGRIQQGSGRTDQNPIPIITRDRDGLEDEHPFVKALAAAVESHLEPLIRQEEMQGKKDAARESPRMRRTLDELGRDLGKLINEDLRELDAEGISGGGDGAEDFLLRIIPEEIVMYMGEDKTVSVLVARQLGTTEVEVEFDAEGVVALLNGPAIPLTDHPRRDGYLIGRFKLRPLIEDDETYLVIRAGDEEVGALVEVRPERFDPEPEPPESLRFERDRYHLTQGKRRRLTIQAPIEIVNDAGSLVRVTSSTSEIALLHGGQVELEFDEDLLFFTGQIEVDPRVIGASGELRADLGEHHAQCRVSVGTFGSGPQIQIKIVDKDAGAFRALVERREDGSVEMAICGGHPVLRRYLGPAPDFPLLETEQAKSVLAEIIAAEAARMVAEKKYPSASDLDGAAFYSEHRHYLEKYLLRCHKMMLPGS